MHSATYLVKRFIQVLPRLICAVLLIAAPGCSIKRMAVNKLGDALSGAGTTFAADDDPELIKAAVPFSLKLMESLLEQNPRHRGLLLAASSGFTQYTYAFVQQDADELDETDMAAAKPLRDRARRLYLRARDYGLRGLDVNHVGFSAELRKSPVDALKKCRASEVGLVYWTAVSWAAAIAVSKDDPALVADLGIVEAMIDRALVLDEKFDRGAIHGFLISYEMARSGGSGTPADRAQKHFARAVELSANVTAAPYVSYAESVCIAQEDRAGFEKALKMALSIDLERSRENRLVNTVMQRRARWLLQRIDKHFLPPPPP